LSDIEEAVVVAPPVVISSIGDATAVSIGITELKPSNDAVAKNINEVMPTRLNLTF
jgi:hypothetical protein